MEVQTAHFMGCEWDALKCVSGENQIIDGKFDRAKSYNKDDLAPALNNLKWGLITLHGAAKKFKIHESTLHDHLKGKHGSESKTLRKDLNVDKTKVVGAKNIKSSRTTTGPGKEDITSFSAVSTAGDKEPPPIVFQGNNVWDQWMGDKGLIKVQSITSSLMGIKQPTQLKMQPSTGIDEVPISLIKECLEKFAMCFLLSINKSMELGQFSSRLKTALIVPVLKKGGAKDIKNYRPITLLNFHHGYRNNYSTETAAIELVQLVNESLDKNKHVFGIFFDLTSAFDTLDISFLEIKLEKLGIRGKVLEWIISWMRNRQIRSHVTGIEDINNRQMCKNDIQARTTNVIFEGYNNEQVGQNDIQAIPSNVLFEDKNEMSIAREVYIEDTTKNRSQESTSSENNDLDENHENNN
ncbi:hypothetical protein ILUMI_01947 [Ignelater luminosus]|uniref:Reverse transcriptase domain-containing protein n=1 Tax=Ignelater luminosus TaxID=2038154 RepID=A0A8K0GJR0_IGNLU|nr:hypothetical protein ILUMI_01947 [Ignelater luminosus]